jgi:hypothetical protein
MMALLASLTLPTLALAEENQPPIGTHDGFPEPIADAADECYANGWAADPDDPSARLVVRISLDGSVAVTLVADQFRQDLADAGVSDGFSSFWVDLRPHVTLGDDVTVLVEAQDAQAGTWHTVDGTPRVLTCLSAPPIGFHDIAEGSVPPYDCVAAGWAVDVDSPTDRVGVRVVVDGAVVAETIADLFRQDLVEAGVPGDGNAGFHLDLWPLVRPARWHEVRAQAQDNETGAWSDLEATPRQLRCAHPPTTPFHGAWTAPDFDGSTQSLAFSGGPGNLAVTYRDSFATVCADLGSATTQFVGTGTARLVAPDVIEVVLTTQHCGSTFLGPTPPLYLAYDPTTEQLLSDFGIWTRR